MTQVKTAAEMISEDGPPLTVADLAARLAGAPPDAVVVLQLDGPDDGPASPLEWARVMGYWPESPAHGEIEEWDPEDEPDAGEPDPDVVKVFVLGPRGLPDEARCPHCNGSGAGVGIA